MRFANNLDFRAMLLLGCVSEATPFISIEICGMRRYYYYCTCIAGSKVITFAASAIF